MNKIKSEINELNIMMARKFYELLDLRLKSLNDESNSYEPVIEDLYTELNNLLFARKTLIEVVGLNY